MTRLQFLLLCFIVVILHTFLLEQILARLEFYGHLKLNMETWNRCFICSCELSSSDKPLGFLQSSTGSFSNHDILLKHLLGNPHCTPEERRLYDDILQLSEAAASRRQPVIICIDCDKRAEQLMEKQRLLEEIHYKIVHQLKTIKEVITANSLLYSSGNHKLVEEYKEFEHHLGKEEEQGKDCSLERRLLDILHRFQTVVFEKEYSLSNAPMVRREAVATWRDLNEGGVRQKAAPFFEERFPEDEVKADEDEVKDEGLQSVISSSSDEEEMEGIKEEEETELDCFEGAQVQQQDPLAVPSVNKPIMIQAGTLPPVTLQFVLVSKLGGGNTIKRKGLEENVKKKETTTRKPSNSLPGKSRFQKCELCSFTSFRYCVIEQHLKSHESTSEKNYKCPQCPLEFTQKQTLDRHILFQHSGKRRRKCDLCGVYKIQICTSEMESHLKKDHGGEVFHCKYCTFCCGTYLGLLEHISLPKGEKLTCQLCPADQPSKSFTLKHGLLQHLYEKHGYTDLAMKCDYPNCNQVFFTTHHKLLHRNIHEKKYACDICEKVFRCDVSLKEHVSRKHKKEKNFQCDLCPEAFVWSESLRSHKAVKHGGEMFKCELCPGKEYVNKQNLREHINVCHGEGKRWKCEVCGKEMGYKKVYLNHLRTHSSEKRDFTCEVCGFATMTNDLLKNHMRQHTGEKKHKCSYCPKAFIAKSALRCHERTHTGEKPYCCEICGVAYSQRTQLTQHKRKKHPELAPKRKDELVQP